MLPTLHCIGCLALTGMLASSCLYPSTCDRQTVDQTYVVLEIEDELPRDLFKLTVTYNGQNFELEADLRQELCSHSEIQERPGRSDSLSINFSLCTDRGAVSVQDEASNVPQKDISMVLRLNDEVLSSLASNEVRYEVVETCNGPEVHGDASLPVDLP